MRPLSIDRSDELPPSEQKRLQATHHWFEPVADHLGSSYLRYSFTRGTVREVDFLIQALRLTPGQRVLDVGCGPGRHANELGRRGLEVVGVDISETFVELATEHAVPGVRFECGDARNLAFDSEFDAAISLCQGAFGLSGPGSPEATLAGDLAVLGSMGKALMPEGLAAVTAFSSYFQVRFLEESDEFDAATGTNHEMTEIRNPAGEATTTDLWTTCMTPRELRLMAMTVGLDVEACFSVEPGRYESRSPDLDSPEFLLIARRPG